MVNVAIEFWGKLLIAIVAIFIILLLAFKGQSLGISFLGQYSKQTPENRLETYRINAEEIPKYIELCWEKSSRGMSKVRIDCYALYIEDGFMYPEDVYDEIADKHIPVKFLFNSEIEQDDIIQIYYEDGKIFLEKR